MGVLIYTIGVDFSILDGGITSTQCTWDYVGTEQKMPQAGDNGGQGVICVLQAILVTYGGMAGAYWVTMVSIALFQSIFFPSKWNSTKKITHIVAHIVCWGLPLVQIIIALGAQEIDGQGSGNHICFIEIPWAYGLFFGPVNTALVIGSVLLIVTIGKVIVIKGKMKARSHVTLVHLIRMSFLLLLYWACFGYLLGYSYYIAAIEQDLYNSARQQVHCSILTGQPCSSSTSINLGAWYLAAISEGSQGIVVFAVVGLSGETIGFWKHLLKEWRNPGKVIRDTRGSTIADSSTTNSISMQ